jgi:hypothetical protein
MRDEAALAAIDEVRADRDRLREQLDTYRTRPLAEERDRLRRAIVEHRTTIRNAGTVRVDSRDEEAAQAKHAADQRLWATVDA